MNSSSHIQLLDTQTINQIAAGEVVERPTSAIKELIENAIDAQSTKIEVELEKFGRSRIIVRDNGCGMNPQEAQTAMLRHATSKIKSVEDLQNIVSFGFRGEALPSIASVSKTTISTGIENGVRQKLVFENGELTENQKISGTQGTEIIVEDLFYNTPARLKFLKSNNTELSLIVECISKYAFAHPGISFTLKHENKLLIQTTGSHQLHQTIAEIWGYETAKQMAPVDFSHNGISITGFISTPDLTKSSRNLQWIFVNQRPIKSRIIQASIDQSYRSITPEKRYPLVVLNLFIHPSRIDINVSPTKTEIKFDAENEVFQAIRYAVKQSLLNHGMILQSLEHKSSPSKIAPTPSFSFERSGEKSVSSPSRFIPSQRPFLSTNQNSTFENQITLQAPTAIETDSPSSEETKYPFAYLIEDFKILGQIMQTFIVAENKRGLILIDQHVAHERILYEHLWKTRDPKNMIAQHLLTPEPLHLDRVSAELLFSQLNQLKQIGFEIEPFGGESFLVRSVPGIFTMKNVSTNIKEMIEDWLHGNPWNSLDQARERIWSTCACKMAVKSGDILQIPEMQKLITDLAETENPYLCPHGRPITLVITKDELFKRFKRN